MYILYRYCYDIVITCILSDIDSVCLICMVCMILYDIDYCRSYSIYVATLYIELDLIYFLRACRCKPAHWKAW